MHPANILDLSVFRGEIPTWKWDCFQFWFCKFQKISILAYDLYRDTYEFNVFYF